MTSTRVGRLLLALVLVPSTVARAQTAADLVIHRYGVDPMHSTIAFASTILGAVHVRGRFTDYDATIIYDPAHPERSSVSAVIQVASLTTDMKFRDDHLRSPDFFDATQFPTIEFTSDRVVPSRDGRRASVSGALTMHGVSRRVVIPATMVLAPHAIGNSVGVAFTALLELSRKDFGIAGTNRYNPSYNPATNMLSDRVEILLELDAGRESYSDRTLGTGIPPGVADTVDRVLRRRGAAAALETYRTLKANDPTAFRFTAGQLDVIGHQLAERGALREAIEVLAYNAQLFGETPGVLESLADAQAMTNDSSAALATYRRALSQSPNSSAAREMVRRLNRLPFRTTK